MPLYQTGGYQVKPSAVNKVKQAIKEFVAYVQTNEPGTHMYLCTLPGSKKMIRLVFCTFSFLRTTPHKLFMASQKL
jgi:hypothetical protein